MKPRFVISRVFNRHAFDELKEASGRLGDLSQQIPAGSTVMIKPNEVLGLIRKTMRKTILRND